MPVPCSKFRPHCDNILVEVSNAYEAEHDHIGTKVRSARSQTTPAMSTPGPSRGSSGASAAKQKKRSVVKHDTAAPFKLGGAGPSAHHATKGGSGRGNFKRRRSEDGNGPGGDSSGRGDGGKRFKGEGRGRGFRVGPANAPNGAYLGKGESGCVTASTTTSLKPF